MMAYAGWLRMHAGLREDGNSSLYRSAGLQKTMEAEESIPRKPGPYSAAGKALVF